MKKVVVMVTLVLVLGSFPLAMASWDKCKNCHKEGDKPAPAKETMLKKFKTAATFIEAAKASKNPMMNSIKGNDEVLKAAAADLGLK